MTSLIYMKFSGGGGEEASLSTQKENFMPTAVDSQERVERHSELARDKTRQIGHGSKD